MKKFDGFCLFSDMDGTLITDKFEIPQKNIEALQYFTDNGGHFALATGRGLHSTTVDLQKMLPVNMPCVMLNGGLIYDFGRQKSLNADVLPADAAQSLVDTLLACYPQHSIAVWCPDHRVELGVSADWMLPSLTGELASVSDPWCKLVVHHHPSEQAEMLAFIEKHLTGGMRTTVSCDRFIEIMPDGVSKGSAIEWLIKHLSIDRSRVLTIGDYYNDLEMLSLPGVRSFCPQNAPGDIQSLCERTLCYVEDAAIAALIAYIDTH
ncbi:MAG TPA: HAD-IIB family hydrolase [Clostridia bacterium]|nr:HAD-IIB family hydrolase [Clostridia bacterium]